MHRILRAITLIACTALASEALAEEAHHGHEGLWRNHPHHASIVLGGTWHGHEEAETIGIDYEYRLNQTLGLGAVLEYATDPLETTTFLVVADIHVWRGLAIQTGPGIEHIEEDHGHDEDLFVYRIGALYEVEYGNFTVSPQLHLDVTSENDSIIGAIAVGWAF
jgi:hypothetical protein